MKKRLVCLTAIALLAFGASASDPSASPLKIFSGGFGGGAMYSVNDELKADVGEVFGKFSLMGSWLFTDNVAFYGDLNWFAAENLGNIGADFGVDYFMTSSRAKPFVGAGVGVLYFDRESEEFGAKFGASLTARVGIAFELTETVEIRLRAPFHVALNQTTDMGVGFDVGVMFFNNLRRVRKLTY